MKKLLLIALLCIPFIGFSQTTKPIEGFLGIKFGSSKAEVIAALNAKGGTLKKNGTDPNQIIYSHVKLGHRVAELLFVSFNKNKVYQANFVFNVELEAQVIEEYYGLVNDINSVYGTGSATKQFQQPYFDGDGFEVQGIMLGKTTYQTNWTSGKNSILSSITVLPSVMLTYTDETLASEATTTQKNKEKSDY